LIVHSDDDAFSWEEAEKDLMDGIDTTVANVARIRDYWLGGKDNYAIDRQVGDQILGILPEVAAQARAARAFLTRAVRQLAGPAGVRQFLDIGIGLPTVENTHQVAQRVAPDARIVYVDNDPVVLAHARALLTGTPEGITAHVQADLRQPEEILRAAAGSLDFTRPVALLLMGVMEYITDDQAADTIVGQLRAALPPGSYLALHHATNVVHGEASDQAAALWNASGNIPLVLRAPAQVARFFTGLDLLGPGVVPVSRWRPKATPRGQPVQVDAFGAVGRIP
jgi:O-methyltransferase involved in polyketide biosynthesis